MTTWNPTCSNAERLLALESRLPAIVQGKDKPVSSECLDIAELCFAKRRYAAAARFYTEALAAKPALAEDPRVGNRFNAACAAALAGCGRGDDVSGLAEADLKALREQARELLQFDLAEWIKRLADGTLADPILAQRMLASWRQNSHLAGLRDPRALNKLPPAERQQWRALWQKVAEIEKSSENETADEPSLARLGGQVEGKWRHFVAGNSHEITLLRGGRINDQSSGAMWTLQGRILRLTWPNGNTPDGAWVDTCRVSEDGKSYLGMNQQGTEIRGTKIH